MHIPYTPAQWLFGAVSLASFPASLVVVYYMMDNRSWCLSDHCVTGAVAPQIRISLAVFYGFLAFTATVILASKQVPGIRRILGKRIYPGTTISFGELGWLLGVLIICCIGLPATYWRYWWDRRGDKFIQQYSWIRLVHHTFMMVSGDCVAVLMGFLYILPSKNSFFATFLDIPYTSMVRMHIWIGFGNLALAFSHFVAYLLSYNLTKDGIMSNLFRGAESRTWGKGGYYLLIGFAAFWVLVIIVGSSLAIVRRKFYNIFFYTHFLTYVYTVMVYLHAQSMAYFLMPGLFMCIIDVGIRTFATFYQDKIANVVFEESGYITVTVATTKANTAKPGQFMRVNLPSVSRFEYHPWSIAYSDAKTVTFMFAPSVKASEWSTLAANWLQSSQQDGFGSIVLQGPYGKAMDMVVYGKSNNVAVFYVGGTGLAASIAAIHKILEDNKTKDIPTKVVLCWSSRSGGTSNMSLIQEWIKTGRVVLELRETAGADQDKSEQVVTQLDGEKSEIVFSGRASLESVLEKHVKPMLVGSEMLVRVGVFICGPAGLTRDGLRDADSFAKENKSASVVEVEAESYEL